MYHDWRLVSWTLLSLFVLSSSHLLFSTLGWLIWVIVGQINNWTCRLKTLNTTLYFWNKTHFIVSLNLPSMRSMFQKENRVKAQCIVGKCCSWRLRSLLYWIVCIELVSVVSFNSNQEHLRCVVLLLKIKNLCHCTNTTILQVCNKGEATKVNPGEPSRSLWNNRFKLQWGGWRSEATQSEPPTCPNLSEGLCAYFGLM